MKQNPTNNEYYKYVQFVNNCNLITSNNGYSDTHTIPDNRHGVEPDSYVKLPIHSSYGIY